MKRYVKLPWYKCIIIEHLLIFLFVLTTSNLVFLGFYYIFQTETTETTAQLTLSRDSQIFSEINNRLNEVKFQVYELYNDGNINLLSALWDRYSIQNRANRIVEVQNYLARIRSKDNFTSDPRVYMLKNNIVIGARDYGAFQDQYLEAVTRLWDQPTISVMRGNALYIYIRQLSLGAQYTPSNFVCELQIQELYLRNILQALYRTDESEGIVLVGNEIFTETISEPEVLSEVLRFYQERRDSLGNAVKFNINIHGNDYFCSAIRLEAYDITLLTVHKWERVFGKMLTLFRIIPVIAIINITAVILFLLYMSRFILQKIELQRAQLKQLQSQIDPHFLYNTLFTLQTRAARKDYEGVGLLSGLLGEYFQFLNRDSRDFVPLEDELRHAYVYAEIQETRFSERFMFVGEPCGDEFKNILVPRLILQPLMENVIKYEVEASEKQGMLCMLFEKRKQKLLIILESSTNISDHEVDQMNRNLHDDTGEREVTSTINIASRLKLFYGEKYSLYYAKGKYGGLKAVVELDYRRQVK